MIWAVLIGWFTFGDLPSLAVTIGAVIVISAGLFVLWRERHLGLVRRDREAASPQRVVGN
jgi:drug/metabolite transporter (DMT)-like permease